MNDDSTKFNNSFGLVLEPALEPLVWVPNRHQPAPAVSCCCHPQRK